LRSNSALDESDGRLIFKFEKSVSWRSYWRQGIGFDPSGTVDGSGAEYS
jgi:hypothetical protein